MIDIIILVNGPGELSSYVKPTVSAIKKISKSNRIFLVFTPCPYATGKEYLIAQKLPGVFKVIRADEFVRWALFRMQPKKVRFNEKGIVVFLGGDVLYGKMIAKRLKYPAIAYSESYARFPKVYSKYLVPDKKIYNKFLKQKFPKDQLKIVGNLMVDSIKINRTKDQIVRSIGLDPKKKIISFLPGSRYFQVQFTFKYFANTAKELSKLYKNSQFIYVISPYLKPETMKNELRRSGMRIKNGRVSFNETEIILATSDQHDVIAASDLVITIPGTNTAEVSIIGTPMIVVFPLASAQMIPLEGVYELLGILPFIGFFFKNMFVKMVQSKTRYFAIPNIKSGKELVPDYKGAIQPKEIAEKAASMLKDKKKLEQMSAALKKVLGKPGASRLIAKEIVNEALS
jgi:UDP-N-acetylglucosamine:LPS N-acetylglucosamine transferase